MVQLSETQVRSANGLRILKDKHPLIRSLIEDGWSPSLHGTRVWRSSYWLMGYLASHPIKPGGRAMEIGCGWGLLGIYCAKLFDARVLLTDADEQVFPFAAAHARLNGVSPECRVSLVIPRGSILLPRGLGPWRQPSSPGFALRSLPYPTPRWSAGHDSALKWLDGVWDALCMLPPRLRDSRPFATAATRSRPRLPGTTRLRFALLGAQRSRPSGCASTASAPGCCGSAMCCWARISASGPSWALSSGD